LAVLLRPVGRGPRPLHQGHLDGDGARRGPLRGLRLAHGARLRRRGLPHPHGPALLHELDQPPPHPRRERMTRTAGTQDGWVLARTDQLSPLELYGILQLRSRVFVVEQECLYTDMDGLDLLPGTQHRLLPADDASPRPAADAHGGASGLSAEPLAYARILPLEVADGPAAQAGARSVGRVVTSPDGRGRGLGRRLLDEV